jgi:hypothetical protein
MINQYPAKEWAQEFQIGLGNGKSMCDGVSLATFSQDERDIVLKVANILPIVCDLRLKAAQGKLDQRVHPDQAHHKRTHHQGRKDPT